MSFLSLMLELNYFEKNDFLILRKIHANVYPEFLYFNQYPDGKMNHLSQILQDDNLLLDELIEELRIIDTGISSIELKKSKKKYIDNISGETGKEREWSSII